MTTTIVNCTPHPIVLLLGALRVTFEPSGHLARCCESYTTIGTLDVGDGVTVPVATRGTGAVEGIPDAVENTCYLVSAMVLAASARSDLLAPDTGAGAVRNAAGHIMGVTGARAGTCMCWLTPSGLRKHP